MEVKPVEMRTDLHIDEEFQSLLPSLTDSEREELERQIKKDGVLNPIIVWNGTIVDGHNRFMICKLNGITDFPIREMEFNDREEVIEWILRHQLGRRNLTDFQRTRIALRYEEVIAKKAKERQLAGLKNVGKTSFCSMEQNDKKDTHTTREEVAKIADTSPSTVMRTKYILEHGTEEQIARAEKGGVEMDGRRNSIRAIVNEIKGNREEGNKEEETKVCCDCGKRKPISCFPALNNGYRPFCRDCRRIRERGTNCAEVVESIYDTEKEILYTASDLEEEVRENIKPSIKIIEATLQQHTDLMNEALCREMIRNVLCEVVDEVKKLMEDYCDV